ncbi:hypothetical protein NEOKW01_0336 [Nematocida sp. AWRm80]|nr:hypothetical protein NEOKW01_0336 [Nematocida sp. AWRm80]
MFNSDNYHWTEDTYSKEGMSILEEELSANNIKVKDSGSSIRVSQRMGNAIIRYDLSIELTNQENTHCVIEEYSEISTPEEIESTEFREVFIKALKTMSTKVLELYHRDQKIKETTSKKTPSIDLSKISATYLPTAPMQISKTESYKKVFKINGPIEIIIKALTDPQTISFWSRGTILATENPLSLKHQTISLVQKGTLSKDSHSFKVSFTATYSTHPSFTLLNTIAISPRSSDITEVSYVSKDIPIGISNILDTLLLNGFIRPMQQAFNLHIQ